MSLFQWSETEILTFFLLLMRIASFWISWPIFSGATVNNAIKILTVFCISLLLAPTIETTRLTAELGSLMIVPLVIKEVAVGLILGFICRFIFFILSMAGEMVSSSVGFAQGQLFNPTPGTQSTVIEQFYVLTRTVIFLAVNGHHYFLKGLVESFHVFPMGSEFHLQSLIKIADLFSQLFAAGFQMAAPIVITIFFLNFGLGVLGRAVPQINVLVTSFPVNVIGGLLMMIVSLPLWFSQMKGFTSETMQMIFSFMKEF